jgi:20S proteasome subunit alpha 2
MVYSGMGPDYRVIVQETRKEASIYKQKYGEIIPVEMLVQNVATIFQVK